MKYGILISPHANKRYEESIRQLAMAELKVIIEAMSLEISDFAYENIGGIELLCFKGDLAERAQAAVMRLSSLMVLFEVLENDLLRPINQPPQTFMHEDMPGILKYKGKTNEMFTMSLINLAVFSGDFAQDFDRPLHILDPMCGRGTALYAALVRGYHAAGVELDKKDVQEMSNFVKRYLEFHKFKHHMHKTAMTVNGKNGGQRTTFEIAHSAKQMKVGETRIMTYILGDAVHCASYFKGQLFDALVCDLPYGIQHSGMDKGPVGAEKLLNRVLPSIDKVLKPGAGLALSFNAYTCSRNELIKILSAHHYHVFTEDSYAQLEHWVEQAVLRDVVVAKKMTA